MFAFVAYVYHHWHLVMLVCLLLSVLIPLLIRKKRWIPWTVVASAAIWGLGMYGKSYRKEWRIRKRDEDSTLIEARNDSLLKAHPDTRFDLAHFLPEASRLVGQMHKDKDVVLVCSPWVEIENGVTQYHYHFDPGKGRQIMGFSLCHITGSDTEAIEREFLSYVQSATNDTGAPGLSYGNDYVWKGDHDIFSLHTGCHYAYFNHITFRSLAMANSAKFAITDSVVCHCGDFICDTNRDTRDSDALPTP